MANIGRYLCVGVILLAGPAYGQVAATLLNDGAASLTVAPGVVELDGQPLMYLGELMFYNQGRTPDRARLRTFVLNCVAVATVARYVRDVVRKSLPAA